MRGVGAAAGRANRWRGVARAKRRWEQQARRLRDEAASLGVATRALASAVVASRALASAVIASHALASAVIVAPPSASAIVASNRQGRSMIRAYATEEGRTSCPMRSLLAFMQNSRPTTLTLHEQSTFHVRSCKIRVHVRKFGKYPPIYVNDGFM